jgi:large subunit ribosomal protein L7/L12
MAEMTQDQVVDYLSSLNVLQLGQLLKELEGKWGVSAASAMPAMMMPAGGAGEAGAAKVEEQTEFTVMLTGFAADKKIQVIKEIRGVTSLGLKEAKDLVEGSPAAVKEGVTKAEAADIKAKLEAAGGTVEVK